MRQIATTFRFALRPATENLPDISVTFLWAARFSAMLTGKTRETLSECSPLIFVDEFQCDGGQGGESDHKQQKFEPVVQNVFPGVFVGVHLAGFGDLILQHIYNVPVKLDQR